MIHVRFDIDGDWLTMEVEGHAGQAEKGKDIVCAGASTLAYTYAKVVYDADKNGKLKGYPIIDMNDGKAVISCRPSDEETARDLLTAYDTIRTGFMLLQNQYRRFVEIEEE